ncbi:sigma 54-interacting transcriptional regulator [Rhizobium sp. KVB221]|uniref:Sigma 54-interacting transcriptional regulator n=1 Tax=Rhizobium setariae TaxID=2801340 RepID=A0A936YVL2_9HYPH|nr:sigma 54-interacting transcriptional regulator [Rhizobium setariae]MBL0373785.1 sigma 54-interacting transcriptional regulator [Rhizobium setariae]
MKFYGNDIANLAHRRLRPTFIDDPMFSTFLEALPDGAALLETDGTIKLVNSKLELLLNLNKGDLVGKELARHAKTAGPIIHKVSTALQQLKRLEISGALNSQRQVAASLSILRTGDGGAYGALLVMREPNRAARTADAGLERFRFQEEGGAPVTASYAQTPALRALSKQGTVALERGSAILLSGESGTGKTELARRIGKMNEPGAAPFVHVNCGMLGDAQFDAEMFGIEPGSTMDASTRGKLGYIEAADGGTLFLDHVTDLSLACQMKLVAFFEAQTFNRVGSAQRRQVQVKVIAAANRTLPDMLADGRFREDLYYRLAVVSLILPPLRGQSDLIRAVAEAQLQRINYGRRPTLKLSEEFWEKLLGYDYPGNIRELSNILEHAAACADDLAMAEHFVTPIKPATASPKAGPAILNTDETPATPASFRDLVQEFETWVLEKSIAENGSKRSAAKALGIDIATLVRKTNRKR